MPGRVTQGRSASADACLRQTSLSSRQASGRRRRPDRRGSGRPFSNFSPVRCLHEVQGQAVRCLSCFPADCSDVLSGSGGLSAATTCQLDPADRRRGGSPAGRRRGWVSAICDRDGGVAGSFRGAVSARRAVVRSANHSIPAWARRTRDSAHHPVSSRLPQNASSRGPYAWPLPNSSASS